MSEAPVGEIRSRDNPLLVKLRKLAQDPSAYRKLGLLWLEGDHLARALQSRGGRAVHALVAESAWAQQPSLRTLAGWAARTSVLPDALMRSLSTLESPAPIGFVVEAPTPQAVEAGLPTVVLDRLQDAGNVGSILRSASAMGFSQVVALKGTAALWSAKVLRAGMGAHFALRLVEAAEEGALDGLGVQMVATSSHAEAALPTAPLPWPCAWVLGHEGRGVAPALLERCALTVRIPQPGGEESLNVAAAAAVCLYESARRRAV